jgi:hypothetical protein
MSSTDSEANEGIEVRAKRAFDDSVSSLDAQTRSRLAQARAQALEQARRRPWWPARGLVPGAIAAATALAVWMLWQDPTTQPGGVEIAALQDLEILLGEEELEMLEELDFYTWLDEELAEQADEDDSVG